jgi:transposase
MITAEMLSQMRRLVLVEGMKIETVARRFGVHHSVVRRALRESNGLMPTRLHRPSNLTPWKPYIVQRLTELPQLTAARIFTELRSRGYDGSAKNLRRYVSQVRGPKSTKAYLRVEFEPAEQAQVDWGSFGYLRVGKNQRPLSVFAMVLSWSRALFIDFSLDQKMETFCQMHARALEFFGGVPRRVIYDNLKSVVLSHVGPTVQFNPRFLAFAGHYLFEPTAAPVRYPQFKGRVEGSIKFIRHSFFYGRSFHGLEDIRAQAARWRDEVANTRIHGTTRERPCERLLIERGRLRELPKHPFDSDTLIALVVSKELRIRFDTNSYSVPPGYVGKTVQLRADDRRVRIFCDGSEIAVHARSWDKHRHIEDPAHVEALLDRRKAGRPPSRRERLVNACPQARLYLNEVARRRIRLDHELDKLFRLVDLYGDTEVSEAIAKAVIQKSFGARFVHALCDQARFARGQGEPPEPVVTGNRAADSVTIVPHSMETYDALFNKPNT